MLMTDPLPWQAEAANSATEAAELRSPGEVRRRCDRLLDKQTNRVGRSRRLAKRFDEHNQYLAVAEKVTAALEQLNQQLFQQLLGIVQEKLTIALQEILEQPIQFKATAEF